MAKENKKKIGVIYNTVIKPNSTETIKIDVKNKDKLYAHRFRVEVYPLARLGVIEEDLWDAKIGETTKKLKKKF